MSNTENLGTYSFDYRRLSVLAYQFAKIMFAETFSSAHTCFNFNGKYEVNPSDENGSDLSEMVNQGHGQWTDGMTRTLF